MTRAKEMKPLYHREDAEAYKMALDRAYENRLSSDVEVALRDRQSLRDKINRSHEDNNQQDLVDMLDEFMEE